MRTTCGLLLGWLLVAACGDGAVADAGPDADSETATDGAPDTDGPADPGTDDAADDVAPDHADDAAPEADVREDDAGDDVGPVDPPAPRPLVGAIRWDAWQEEGAVQAAVEASLNPAHWRWRAPWFGTVDAEARLRFAGNRPEVMDAEIAFAVEAGVDYWAFVTYPESLGMTNALRLYLASADRRVRFCLNLQGGWIAHEAASWNDQVARYVDRFRDPRYVLVEGDRPLVFLFDASGMLGAPGFEDPAEARVRFDALRAASVAVGLGEPYFVLQGWSPTSDAVLAEALGFDALGAYAVAGGADEGQPYAALAASAAATWEAHRATGAEVVPVVTAGWDRRPRVETPVPWDPSTDARYTVSPTAAELAVHLLAALRWTRDHPLATPADAILVYAWNEHDEGGWLCPTLDGSGGADASRVEALGAALAGFEASPRVANGSFERPAAPDGWYVVPAGGLPESFGWDTDAPAGTYFLADARAVHFEGAAHGAQALLVPGRLEQSVGVLAAGVVHTLAFSLLAGTYPGDPAGTVLVEVREEDVALATRSLATPATPGVWESRTLDFTPAGVGSVTVRFSATAGMSWLDAVSLRR
ncbi:MAG: hypothetical protein JXB32_22025 [Deltaproteobacteria bacterium]|nr:hypothetical protein [Deltaproteobacteria bacterium]